MARISGTVNYSTFIGGKVSDTNPLSPPENVVRTLMNVEVNNNGKIGRRLGLEPESNFNLPVNIDDGTWLSGLTVEAYQSMGVDIARWISVDNQPGLNYRVVRLGNQLNVYHEGGATLSNSLVKVLDISEFATTNVEHAAAADFQAITGKGLLICAGSEYTPFYVEYNTETFIWTMRAIEIEIRDLMGVNDGLAIDTRPATLSESHKYNLLNQGWSLERIETFRQATNTYPSNADIVYLGDSVNSNGDLIWKPLTVRDNSFGNTPAPKGHFIIDPFSGTSRAIASGTGLDGANIDRRPRAISFFAGRVFYASVDGNVYFSRIVRDKDDLGKCYQEQDPTVEELNALLDTDGGVIPIIDIVEVSVLTPLDNALIIFGTNGLYTLSGGESGFTANNQLLKKMTNISVAGPRAVVPAEGAVFFWAEEGIYVITTGEFGREVINSLSENRIQRDYNAIPPAGKTYCQGVYDRIERKVYWCYSMYTYNEVEDISNKYTDILVYSVPTNAFWDYRLTNVGFTSELVDYPILGGLLVPAYKRSGVIEEVVTSGGATVTSGGEDVTTDVLVSQYTNETLKALVFLPDSTGLLRPTFGQFSSRTFHDWAGLTQPELEANLNYRAGFPVAPFASGNYNSIVETLPQTLGEPTVTKQGTYIHTYYDFQRNGFGEYQLEDQFFIEAGDGASGGQDGSVATETAGSGDVPGSGTGVVIPNAPPPGDYFCASTDWTIKYGDGFYDPALNSGAGAWTKAALADRYITLEPAGTWSVGYRPAFMRLVLYSGAEYLVNADPTSANFTIINKNSTSLSGSGNPGWTGFEQETVLVMTLDFTLGGSDPGTPLGDIGDLSLDLGGAALANYMPEIRCISFHDADPT